MVLDLAPLVAGWPDPDRAALIVTDADRVLGRTGPTTEVAPVASISKVFAAITAMVAVEEGTLELDAVAGPRGATVRHLLAHASGLAFDVDDQLAAPGTRRIYSNVGIDVFADHLARLAGMPFETYQREAVIDPLGLTATRLVGSPAHGVHATAEDLAVFARELLRPTLIGPETLRLATTVHFPELRGVIPGFGTHDPNPWGLGIEIRGHKQPHWTARSNSPETFGHFGGTGTYLWVDPVIGIAAAAISGTEYGPWANDIWPATNEAIIAALA